MSKHELGLRRSIASPEELVHRLASQGIQPGEKLDKSTYRLLVLSVLIQNPRMSMHELCERVGVDLEEIKIRLMEG